MQNYGYKGCPGRQVDPCGLDKTPTQATACRSTTTLQWAPGDIMQVDPELSDVQRIHGQLQRDVASARLDAERGHGRRRPRRVELLPALPR